MIVNMTEAPIIKYEINNKRVQLHILDTTKTKKKKMLLLKEKFHTSLSNSNCCNAFGRNGNTDAPSVSTMR